MERHRAENKSFDSELLVKKETWNQIAKETNDRA